jgi:hypothetical protein
VEGAAERRQFVLFQLVEEELKAVVKIALPSELGALQQCFLCEGPQVWLCGERGLWSAQLDEEEWKQSAVRISNEFRVVGIVHDTHLLLSTASETELLPDSHAKPPLYFGRPKVAAQLDLEAIQLLQSALVSSRPRFLRELQLAESELTVCASALMPLEAFFPKVAQCIGDSEELQVVGTQLGLVVGIRRQTAIVFVTPCSSLPIVSCVLTDSHIVVVDAAAMCFVLEFDGSVVFQHSAHQAVVLPLADRLVWLDEQQDQLKIQWRIWDDSPQTVNSQSLLRGVQQRVAAGSGALRRQQSSVAEKWGLYNQLVGNFGESDAVVKVVSITQSFDSANRLVLAFRLQTDQPALFSEIVLLSNLPQLDYSPRPPATTPTGPVFDRVVQIALNPELNYLQVAIGWRSGGLCGLGRIHWPALLSEQWEFRNKLHFHSFHSAAGCTVLLQLCSRGATRDETLQELVRQWQTELPQIKVETAPLNGHRLNLQVWTFEQDALPMLLDRLQTMLPPDVTVTVVSAERPQQEENVKSALEKELQLCLESPNSVKNVLAAQITSDQALCALLQSHCQVCAKLK